ncbi:MAG TPA: hypothetical protein VEA92_00820 [Candidatus Paceibacterota bacterium]|nr:hypothetical protein [Candidatus Paceibacterota bacterium]
MKRQTIKLLTWIFLGLGAVLAGSGILGWNLPDVMGANGDWVPGVSAGYTAIGIFLFGMAVMGILLLAFNKVPRT